MLLHRAAEAPNETAARRHYRHASHNARHGHKGGGRGGPRGGGGGRKGGQQGWCAILDGRLGMTKQQRIESNSFLRVINRTAT